DWLFPRVNEDVEALNLVSHFSEDELQRLADQLPGATFLGLASTVAELPWEDVQKQRLLESLTAAIRNRGGFRPFGLTTADEGTVARARERVIASFHSDRLLEIEVRVLLALLFKWETDEYPTSAVEALEETMGEALSRGRLDLAGEILTAMRSGAVRVEWVAEHGKRSQALFAGAGDRNRIVTLVELIKENRTTENAERVTEYLRLVGDPGIREFVALLAEEQNRSVRAFMCQVLVRTGTAAVPHLLPRVKDRQWYVARNAVTILGQIGDPSTLPALIEASRYPDPRVRKEAAQALGTWGADGTLAMLLGLLDDPDPTVQMTLVNVIGRLGSEEAVRALKDLALVQNGRSISVPVREETIRTLDGVRTEAARRAIREIAHRRLWIWQRPERRVRSLAARLTRGEKLP
ncbi:MAG TPA: HEAT repeat domain-containing protein, partial [Candidatus Methylomirabilis sp.]|nr:HEAT repeat domain-containing protein [Candidatus Methylomirabilis sp.]